MKKKIIGVAWLNGFAICLGVVIRQDENGNQRAWIGPDIRSNIINADEYRHKRHTELEDMKHIMKRGAKLDLQAASMIVKKHGESKDIEL